MQLSTQSDGISASLDISVIISSLSKTLRAVLLSKHTEYERKQRSPAQPGRSHTGHGVSGEDESFLRSFACLLSLVFKVRVCLKPAGTAAEALESFTECATARHTQTHTLSITHTHTHTQHTHTTHTTHTHTHTHTPQRAHTHTTHTIDHTHTHHTTHTTQKRERYTHTHTHTTHTHTHTN